MIEVMMIAVVRREDGEISWWSDGIEWIQYWILAVVCQFL